MASRAILEVNHQSPFSNSGLIPLHFQKVNMKVTGFSFVKNALLYEYPVVESIRSILPLCDEFVIAVGKSDDGTLQLIEEMNNFKTYQTY